MLCSQVWLGDALHNHTDLELLDLHHTKIGDDDAISLAEVRAAASSRRRPATPAASASPAASAPPARLPAPPYCPTRPPRRA